VANLKNKNTLGKNWKTRGLGTAERFLDEKRRISDVGGEAKNAKKNLRLGHDKKTETLARWVFIEVFYLKRGDKRQRGGGQPGRKTEKEKKKSRDYDGTLVLGKRSMGRL